MLHPQVTTDSSRHGPELTVRRLQPYDVAFAADLHLRCLPDGFFAKLGVPFLQTYYGCFVRSPWAICLMAEIDHRPAGILVGTVDSWQHYRFLVRRCGWRLGWSGSAALVSRPSLAAWFLRTRGRRYARGVVRMVWRRLPATQRDSAVLSPALGHETAGLLVHVAVDPSLRRSGAGAALVGAFLDGARSRGVRSARLLTATGDEGTRCFYEDMGWDQAGELVDVDGKRWARFVRGT